MPPFAGSAGRSALSDTVTCSLQVTPPEASQKSVITELKDAVAGAAEAVGPSVVGLGRGWGRGSGVVTAPGVVLTNAHVLRGDEVAVSFADGRTELGKVGGADADL